MKLLSGLAAKMRGYFSGKARLTECQEGGNIFKKIPINPENLASFFMRYGMSGRLNG
ncbi:MAG: hypothetical protein NTY70_20465 [Burkholderiales bacterium]|nr:hypothetical protein [Burkholderiales bacterium]